MDLKIFKFNDKHDHKKDDYYIIANKLYWVYSESDLVLSALYI
jgi:hypothetical protein